MKHFPAKAASEENGASGENEQLEQIEKTGSITAMKGRHPIHCLTIIGQVEGHYILPSQNKTTKYEHVIPQLAASCSLACTAGRFPSSRSCSHGHRTPRRRSGAHVRPAKHPRSPDGRKTGCPAPSHEGPSGKPRPCPAGV